MFVSPKFMCWGANLHVAVFGDRVSTEVIKITWGDNVGSWLKRISILIESNTKDHSLPHFSFSHPLSLSLLLMPVLIHRGQGLWGLREKAAVCKLRKEASPGTKSTGILSYTFQPPELWEISVYCLSHPGCGILSWWLKLRHPLFCYGTFYWVFYFSCLHQTWLLLQSKHPLI